MCMHNTHIILYSEHSRYSAEYFNLNEYSIVFLHAQIHANEYTLYETNTILSSTRVYPLFYMRLCM